MERREEGKILFSIFPGIDLTVVVQDVREASPLAFLGSEHAPPPQYTYPGLRGQGKYLRDARRYIRLRG